MPRPTNGHRVPRFDEQAWRRRHEALAGRSERDARHPQTLAADPERELVRLLDEAHEALPAQELAEVLLGARREIAPLLGGRTPRRPAGRLPAAVAGSPAARAYLRPMRVTLYLAARHSGADAGGELTRLGARLDAYLEDLAARPRGSAVPAAS
jgi:hypothetical protein